MMAMVGMVVLSPDMIGMKRRMEPGSLARLSREAYYPVWRDTFELKKFTTKTVTKLVMKSRTRRAIKSRREDAGHDGGASEVQAVHGREFHAVWVAVDC